MGSNNRRYPGARYREAQLTPSLFDALDLAEDAPTLPAQSKAAAAGGAEGTDLYYMSFGSGSSGNCAYIGTRCGGMLVDAGVPADHVFGSLERNGIAPEQVRGILVTHDHGDHVRYLYNIVRTYRHIGVYCTPKAFAGIMRRHSVSRRLRDYHKAIYKEFPFRLADFEVTAFEVSHDGTDNAGFAISAGGKTFVVATDLGCITDRVDHYMRLARYVMIEANYDAQMLREGPYPEHLKARIAAYNGHMDNAATAEFLSGIYTPGLRGVFLCHLSSDNNHPQCALATVGERLGADHSGLRLGDGSGSLEARDADMQLVVLPRFESSPLYRLR